MGQGATHTSLAMLLMVRLTLSGTTLWQRLAGGQHGRGTPTSSLLGCPAGQQQAGRQVTATQ